MFRGYLSLIQLKILKTNGFEDFSILVEYLLVVSRVDHEVALGMLAHWADLRSLLADNHVTAV